MEKVCLECETKIIGRSDKKFCSDYCRNSFNYRQNAVGVNYVRNIINSLKRNRRILADLSSDETTKTSALKLISKGFNFEFFTHLRTTKKGQTYFFVFEYGYLKLDESTYLIVYDQKK